MDPSCWILKPSSSNILHDTVIDQNHKVLQPYWKVIKLHIFTTYKWARVFVPGKPYQPSTIILTETGAYLRGEPGVVFTKHRCLGLISQSAKLLMEERLAREKHCSLLCPFVSYEEDEVG